ncbi:polyketide synthase [uncultured Aquimarina sp.]|uniref:polyketide synthase n=1 Tax=uncultured Aquimarina sp. TaxID=575652 RepID=UPI0026137E19|nr:polyketide synthase [uncultured Aquimarina sp.]
MESVVKLKELGHDIVEVTMCDKEARNTFSERLINGLVDIFEKINNNTAYKVVILAGYDNYFCCGGTKDELIAIHKGEIVFNENPFFTAPLHCKIPVISAMQGHGIGGGFVFGLYADFCILGKENIYTTNFMNYGFTPGMGGTYMVPFKLGSELGKEMLFSGLNYRGQELKERGIPFKVVPKVNVLKEAFSFAKTLSQKPRISLITLKEHMNGELKKKLPTVIDQELKMHEITFHQPEVAERIEKMFGR